MPLDSPRGERGMREETEHAEAVVERHHHDSLRHEPVG
jgi:hypothetical protein